MYKTSFIFIAKKCQSLWKKSNANNHFFHFVLSFLYNMHVYFNKKKSRDIIYSFWGAILNKTEKWKTAFFLLYNNNTTPRSSTKSYNKNVQGWFLPVCFSPAILHMITLKTPISQESWFPQYLKNLNLVLVTSQAIFHVFTFWSFLQAFYLCQDKEIEARNELEWIESQR